MQGFIHDTIYAMPSARYARRYAERHEKKAQAKKAAQAEKKAQAEKAARKLVQQVGV